MREGPLSEEIAAALSKCFSGGAGPSHRELAEVFHKAGVSDLDPAHESQDGASKEVRVRIVLGRVSQDHRRIQAAGGLVRDLLARMRVFGSFDEDAETQADPKVLRALRDSLETEGWVLDSRGRLSPLVLTEIDNASLRPALDAQIARLRNAPEDAALLLGTAKELLESSARYVLDELSQPARKNASFDELMHLARERLGLLPKQVDAEDAAGRAVRKAYDGLGKVAEAVNELRNIEGTGHGRTLLPATSPATARALVEASAVLSQVMLSTLDRTFATRYERAPSRN